MLPGWKERAVRGATGVEPPRAASAPPASSPHPGAHVPVGPLAHWVFPSHFSFGKEPVSSVLWPEET
jgi:hypothetical protein